MRRLLKTSSVSALLVLLLAITFSASQAQNAQPHLQYRQGYNQILMGKVVNAKTGQPIANAEVTIMTSGIYASNGSKVQNYGMRVETTATTNQDGMFLVKNLSPGRHTIKVRKNHYQYWQNTVSMLMGMNRYHGYNGLSSFGYYMHGGSYPYNYGYGNPHNNERQPPFHGFFRPDSNATGFFHGVFSPNNTNNRNNNAGNQNHNNNYRANSYSKGLFLIIRLQAKNQ